jgi:glucuronate isomerase
LETLLIEAGDRSPEVHINFEKNEFSFKGHSYMSNADGFWKPILEKLNPHLESLNNSSVVCHFDMAYFNSSSARVIFHLLAAFDTTGGAGNQVSVNWHFEENDDGMEEQGAELAEDFENIQFELRPYKLP